LVDKLRRSYYEKKNDPKGHGSRRATHREANLLLLLFFPFSYFFRNYNNNNKTKRVEGERPRKEKKRGENQEEEGRKKKVQSADMKGANVIRTATVEKKKKKNISYLLLNPPCLSRFSSSYIAVVVWYLFIYF
jgi:hypothetical protein